MTEDVKVSTGEPGPNDVVFDCVNCGRSLCIDTVAAGFTIICPHCSTEQRVPGEAAEPGPEEEEAGADETMAAENEDLQFRNQQLENMLAVQQGRLEQISREMALIQAAIDRVVGLLQDAQVTPPGENDSD
jgi:hypothetical protein